ncbi:hypothetical protein AX16_004694 [Volvariella volvacea WC 439]|nr:hypothetical protein AX16_004694 [Volvariella volvacea WC 439]
MPGPGRAKAKAKTKPKSASNAPTQPLHSVLKRDHYIGNIDNAMGWHMIIMILCDAFELPDLTTRSGLKKVHANFASICQKLDAAYEGHKDNERLAGGIVGIYAKMCSDSILRNKLWAKGLLDKILPLLDKPSARHLALRTLGTVTHHGGGTVRMDIAQKAPLLIKTVQDNSYDFKTAELAITVLSHSVAAYFDGAQPLSIKTIQLLELPKIIKLITETVKKQNATPYLISHGIGLIARAAHNAPSTLKSIPSSINLLVAGLRSHNWTMKSNCLSGLLLLHQREAEEDQRTLDPYKFMAAITRGFPDHISDLMMDYGPTRCETYLTLETTRDFQRAMIAVVQNRNLYDLGLKLAEFILRTEFSISEGWFQSEDPVTGQLEAADFGMPFKTYTESLPYAAKAIRAKGKPNEMDYADVIDIKYLIMKQRVRDAVSIAKKSLVRNPHHAYFYYAITLAADPVEGLRAGKKGLKCKIITPFIRFQMLQRAVEQAGEMGVKYLQAAHEGEKEWEEGIAFLMSAYEDAKTYVEQAPPDNRHMKNMLYWLILLSIVVRGSEIGPDLREIKHYIENLKVADEISTFIGVPPPKTYVRLAQQTVVKLFSEAVAEYGSMMSIIDSKDLGTITPERAEDELAAWLEELELELEDEHEHEHGHGHDHGAHTHAHPHGVKKPKKERGHPNVNSNHVSLYRCSWCGNPSAVLKKCSGCSITR